MHSPMLYLMTLTLLVVILSTYIHVQATPIPIPATSQNPDDLATGIAILKSDTTGPIYEAMDPSKMDVFERAEDATAKFLDKRSLDVATAIPIKRSTIDTIDTFLNKRAVDDTFHEGHNLSADDDKTENTEAIFEPMDPAMMIAFERAEDATAKFMAKRSDDLIGMYPVERRDTDEDRVLSVDDGSNSEKRETSSLGIRPPRCPDACPAVYEPLCAYNSKGVKQTFGNECELGR
ncbi:hypothetical protein EC991_006957 [Linnemannia zychae]|nr:hypothetical protein EC991_006957 [Linnemannia zychae]